MASERQQKRDEGARARGFASYYAERTAKAKAKGYERGYSEQRKARAGKAPLAKGDRPGRVSQPRRETTTSIGMRVVQSRDARYLAKTLRGLGDTPVTVRLTVHGSGSKGGPKWRTFEVGTGKNARTENAVRQGIRALMAGNGWSHVDGKVTLIVGRGGTSARAFLPPPKARAPRRSGGRSRGATAPSEGFFTGGGGGGYGGDGGGSYGGGVERFGSAADHYDEGEDDSRDGWGDPDEGDYEGAYDDDYGDDDLLDYLADDGQGDLWDSILDYLDGERS